MIWNGYTGAAGWLFRQALEGVVGARLEDNQIVLPADLEEPRGELTVFGISRDLRRKSLAQPCRPGVPGDRRPARIASAPFTGSIDQRRMKSMRCATYAAAVGGTLLVAITAIGENMRTIPAITPATAKSASALRFSHRRCPAPARPRPVGKRHALPCHGEPSGRALFRLSGRGLERRAGQGPLLAILHPIDGHRRMDRNARQCRRRPCRHSLPVPGAGIDAA